MDLEAALQPDVGIPEAIALFGPPRVCRSQGASYLGMELAPRHAGVRSVALETKDGALIGLLVEYDPPVPVDIVALAQRWGTASTGPAGPGGGGPGADTFNLDVMHFRAQLLLDRRVRDDPPTARLIHRVIVRRTPMIEILPECFRSQGDLVRLLVLALQPIAPPPMAFAGTIGVAKSGSGTRTDFAPPAYAGGPFVPPQRNVSRAWIDHVTVDGRDRLKAMRVEIEEPIRADPALIATVLSKRLGAEVSAVPEPTGVRLHVGHPRATVMIESAAGTITAVEVSRAE
jgi:hypothetical protein